MKNILSVILFLSLPFLLFFVSPPQNEIRLGAMTCKYQLSEDSIEFELHAPTTGWLAIGFNNENNIVGSDLLQFSVQSGNVVFQDQFVLGPQIHPTDLTQGGACNIDLIEGVEQNGATRIRFKIPLDSGDRFDYTHIPGEPLWVILAYSAVDDFEHHSLMRKHLKTKWQ